MITTRRRVADRRISDYSQIHASRTSEPLVDFTLSRIKLSAFPYNSVSSRLRWVIFLLVFALQCCNTLSDNDDYLSLGKYFHNEHSSWDIAYAIVKCKNSRLGLFGFLWYESQVCRIRRPEMEKDIMQLEEYYSPVPTSWFCE